MNRFIFIICVIASLNCWAQGSIRNNEELLYSSGTSFYDQGQYNQAREKFEQYIRIGENKANIANAEYYRAMSALKLFHQDGEFLMDKFVNDYPFHPNSATAYFTIGDYYYRNEKYREAVPYFRKAKAVKSNQYELPFKLGYSHFSLKQFPEAKSQFELVTDDQSQYWLPAHYYKGYIHFRKSELPEALGALEVAASDEGYKASSAEMIASIYLQQGENRKCIRFINEVLGAGGMQDPKLYYIQGNAYYNAQEYQAAIEAFEKGLDMSNRKAQTEVYFNLAESYRKAGNTEKAIEYYSFSALDDGEIGNYSSFYLGTMYIESGNLEFAKNSFWKALKSKKQDIREEAIFKLIKVEFDLGNYAECIEGIERYKINFPQGDHMTEANEFLTEAFLNTSDYELAIRYIENLVTLSPAIKRTYQKVNFLMGARQFNNSKFSSAVYYFDKSLTYEEDRGLNIKAHFWKAEAYSIGKKYESAINSYKSALYISHQNRESDSLKLMARYGLGYVYFNQKDYETAEANFKTYLQSASLDNEFKADAHTRMADCQYITKQYDVAIQNYSAILNYNKAQKDYAHFQQGVVYALKDQKELAKQEYSTVISGYPSSGYRDNAIFQLAELFFESTEYDQAISGFSGLITAYPESQLIPFAYQKRAISNFNLKNYDEAIADYQYILTKFITHETANGALLGLQEIYAVTGNTDDFTAYLDKYKEANPDDSSLESIEFEAGKSVYYNQRYQKAIGALTDFRAKYPESSFNTEANYLIADSYYRTEDRENAILAYADVIADGNSKYLNRSLYRIASLHEEKQNFSDAINYYQQLKERATRRRDVSNSWSGLMTTYYAMNNYDSALKYANDIQDNPKTSSDAKSKATLLLGKIFMAQKNFDMASDQFIQLMNGIKDENAAEAKYNLGKAYFLQGKYGQSLEILFEMNKEFASYETWLGKSFLLIADNYIAQEELFQAKATLNSIIENSSNTEIVEQAKSRLLEIEKLEEEVIEKVELDTATNQN